MIYVHNNSEDPFFNHALEEFLLLNMEEDVFILWKNRPSILIGRNQNVITEINEEYVKKEGIEVVRRLSGGGSVFNDYGNINFTFINKKVDDNPLNTGFEKFALPVIEALNSLGARAVFTGRNDIVIDDKKISGNAQYFHKNKVLHHGTLLFSGNLEKLAKALKTKPLKYKGKGVKSVRSRVTNISEHLLKEMDVLEFKDYLKNYIMLYHSIVEEYYLTKEQIKEVEKIQKTRFESSDWNYGKNPEFNFSSAVKFPSGTLEVMMRIHEEKIKSIKIFGDFFGERPIEEVERRLKNISLNREQIFEELKDIDINQYIKGVSSVELIDILTNDKLEI